MQQLPCRERSPHQKQDFSPKDPKQREYLPEDRENIPYLAVEYR
jgi:hypothetical protein